MDLELSEDQELFRATTRRFVEDQTPVGTARRLRESPTAFDASWWSNAADLGWFSLLAPEEIGGGGLSGSPVADAAIVAEELGRQVGPGPFIPVSVVVTALTPHCDQHRSAIDGIASGQTVATWAVAEREANWDSDRLTTTLEPSGEDLVLNGEKVFVEAAGISDMFLVTAKGELGLSQVLVPADSAGLTISPSRSLDFTRRFGEVRFDAVVLPRAALVGNLGGAEKAVEAQLSLAIALQCAETIGTLDRVFDLTLEYMKDRYAFGRPIASYQALKHRAADIRLWMECAKGLSEALTRSIAGNDGESPMLASAAKSYIGDRSLDIIQECVQFHGGIGVTWEHDLHLYLRRATVNRAVYGTPEEHRESLFQALPKPTQTRRTGASV